MIKYLGESNREEYNGLYIYNVDGHYEVMDANGEFIVSADTPKEAREEIDDYLNSNIINDGCHGSGKKKSKKKVKEATEYNYERLTTISDVINQVRQKGTSAWIWDGDKIKDDVFVYNIFDLLDKLEEYEIELDEDTFIDILENYDGADNTYNWNANISNEVDFRWIKNVGCLVQIHLSGDVRNNYSDWFAISSVDDMLYADDLYDVKDINDRYSATINPFSESIDVVDDETGDWIGECYEIEKEDILKWIAEQTGEDIVESKRARKRR